MRHFHGTYKARPPARAPAARRRMSVQGARSRLRLGGLQRRARRSALPSGAPACPLGAARLQGSGRLLGAWWPARGARRGLRRRRAAPTRGAAARRPCATSTTPSTTRASRRGPTSTFTASTASSAAAWAASSSTTSTASRAPRRAPAPRRRPAVAAADALAITCTACADDFSAGLHEEAHGALVLLLCRGGVCLFGCWSCASASRCSPKESTSSGRAGMRACPAAGGSARGPRDVQPRQAARRAARVGGGLSRATARARGRSWPSAVTRWARWRAATCRSCARTRATRSTSATSAGRRCGAGCTWSTIWSTTAGPHLGSRPPAASSLFS